MLSLFSVVVIESIQLVNNVLMLGNVVNCLCQLD